VKAFHTPLLDANSETCVECGRPVRDYSGKVEHRRGRVQGSKNRPKVVGLTVEQMLASVDHPIVKETCPDRGAQLQEIAWGSLRCPWTQDRRQVFIDGIVACGWPRGEKPPRAVA
jgi:hypothetical protein